MEKTLKIIQTLAKVAKVICQVVFILSLIGGISSLVSLIALGIVHGLNFDEKLLKFFVEVDEKMNMPTLYFTGIVGVLGCASSCVTAKFTQKYLEKELETGTPFTLDGSKQLLKTGIIVLVVPAITSALVGIVYGIFYFFLPTTQEAGVSVDIGLGVAMIILSVVFKYGAQAFAETEKSSTPTPEETQKHPQDSSFHDNQEFFQ